MRMILAIFITAFTVSVAYSAERNGRFSIEHMTFALCPITVKKAMASVPGVSLVTVNFDEKEATVQFDDATTTTANIAAASTNAGYPATFLEITP